MTDANAPAAPQPLSLPGVAVPELGDRRLFPDLKSQAYLSHAAIAPASSATCEAVKACLSSVAELGVGSFPMWASQRERLRKSMASLLGADPEQIALTAGCTHGITDLALALPWHESDVLLTYRGEFPANVTPWQLAARKAGATVELLDLPSATSSDCTGRILSELDDRLAKADAPRWVAVSAVQFQTGLLMPLPEMAQICERRKARIFVDGIQACGAVPVDLSKIGVDAFFVGAHKWLLGLEGSGVAYYQPGLMAELSPLTAGWQSHPEAEHFLFQGAGHLRYDRELLSDPRVFEGSTSSAIGFAALEAGVDILQHLGPANVFDHIQAYHDIIEPLLVELGLRSLRPTDPKLRSGILSFSVPAGVGVTKLSGELRRRGVHVSIPDGLVRLAPHFANSVSEAPHVESAFREAISLSRARS